MESLKSTTRLVSAVPASEGAASDSFLLQIRGPDMGSRTPLHRGETRIGRGADCEIVLDSDSVSRLHCSLHVADGGAHLEDQTSTNGTWLNGRRLLQGERPQLTLGDRIQIGDLVFKFLLKGDVEAAYHDELRRLAITDGLTGAFNKAHLLERLEGEIARSQRHGRPLALLLLDLDHFKALNDTHGHLAGDKVLEGVVERISTGFLRKGDLLARFGGEEFALVLPETGADQARVAAERIRRLVKEEAFRYGETSIQVTVSVGIGTLGPETQTVKTLLAQADAKLYEAKRAGRDRVGA